MKRIRREALKPCEDELADLEQRVAEVKRARLEAEDKEINEK